MVSLISGPFGSVAIYLWQSWASKEKGAKKGKKKRINQKIESQWEDLNWKKKSLGLHPDLKKKMSSNS